MIKEACVEGITEALRAQDLGADRIELCENLAVGGTTPSLGTVITCKRLLKIPVIAMIRPRGGNFTYSQAELDTMLADIRSFLEAGADGIAAGVLTPGKRVDLTVLMQLIQEAGNMQVTFHKAIDETEDILREFSLLTTTGIRRVLTSGGAPTALEGRAVLNEMLGMARGITVVVAGKVTSANLADLQSLIPANEFHGRKIVAE
jgi:copper homeostasis protein